MTYFNVSGKSEKLGRRYDIEEIEAMCLFTLLIIYYFFFSYFPRLSQKKYWAHGPWAAKLYPVKSNMQKTYI